jgi:glycosyltransferase involved in cell wall biosynthesis
MKIIAVIPCLNEAAFIGNVVTGAVKFVDRVIVIDDGSSDDTAGVAREAGAEVIRHPHSRGAGAATRTGFEAAKKYGADIVVTLDGDGQHDPSEIPGVIQPVLEGEADITIGSRFLREADVSRYRKFGIDVITWLYNIGHKVKIRDAQSGFRAYSRKALDIITITYPGFGFSIETLVQVRKHGLVINEVSVSCIYHDSGSTEHPVTHGLNVASSVLKIRIKEELFNQVDRQRP